MSYSHFYCILLDYIFNIPIQFCSLLFVDVFLSYHHLNFILLLLFITIIIKQKPLCYLVVFTFSILKYNFKNSAFEQK